MRNKNDQPAAVPFRPILKEKKVRFVGEAIEAVIAKTKKYALYTNNLIELEFDELPSYLKTKVGVNSIYWETPQNKAFDWKFGNKEKTREAFDIAVTIVTIYLIDNLVFARVDAGLYKHENRNSPKIIKFNQSDV
jgi:carbon-monoxide dehydrogenase large subunit